MNRLSFYLLIGCVVCLLSIGQATDEKKDFDEKDVVVLTEKSFEEVVGGSSYALVEFYAPWCGHCKSLAPEYAAAATKLKETNPDIVIAKVDATAEEALAKRFDVTGYPTLKWFVNGKDPVDFAGGRTAPEIVQWISKKTGPPAITLETVSAAEKVIKSGDLFLLGFFPKLEGPLFTEFQALAQSNDELAFYQTSSPEVAKLVGIAGKEAELALGRDFGEGFEAVQTGGHPAFKSDQPLAAQLAFFILQEKLPAYVEFGEKTTKKIFQSGIQNQVIFIGGADELDPTGPLITSLKAVHKEHKGRIVLVTVKLGEKTTEQVTQYFGADPDVKTVQIFGFNVEAGKKYPFSGKPTQETISQYVSDLVDGKLVPLLKSEEAPTTPAKAGEVVVVTGKTLDEIAKDPTKDVLLEIYAPWCGHCKSLEPKYKKLAKRFKKVKSVVIAKFDGTANEHADINIKGFPAIKFYPAGEDSEPIDYEGDRSLKAMTKFLADNAKIPFTLPKKKQDGDDDDAKDAKDEL